MVAPVFFRFEMPIFPQGSTKALSSASLLSGFVYLATNAAAYCGRDSAVRVPKPKIIDATAKLKNPVKTVFMLNVS